MIKPAITVLVIGIAYPTRDSPASRKHREKYFDKPTLQALAKKALDHYNKVMRSEGFAHYEDSCDLFFVIHFTQYRRSPFLSTLISLIRFPVFQKSGESADL
jgi:hypothetical protein